MSANFLLLALAYAPPPPTPTAMPPTEPIELPALREGISMWEIAPNAVGFWNQFGEYTPAIQWILLFMTIISLVFLMMFLMRRFGERKDE